MILLHGISMYVPSERIQLLLRNQFRYPVVTFKIIIIIFFFIIIGSYPSMIL